MLDFTDVKAAIVDDLKPICCNNYLILTQLNILPNELNLIISNIILKEYLYILNDDIITLRKEELYMMLFFSKYINIDVLSPEYIGYLDLSSIDCISFSYYLVQLVKPVRKCSDALYKLDDQIYYILSDRLNDRLTKNLDKKFAYTDDNIKYLISKMKTNYKYSSLLK